MTTTCLLAVCMILAAPGATTDLSSPQRLSDDLPEVVGDPCPLGPCYGPEPALPDGSGLGPGPCGGDLCRADVPPYPHCTVVGYTLDPPDAGIDPSCLFPLPP